MQTVCGIVAEFNPFHNGHHALIQWSRQKGATHIVAVMSGNYVQRGMPAITEKRIRTRCALLAGVDLVLELPLVYATATAQRFARGAIEILSATGVVDQLVFGSECGDAEALRRLAEIVEHPTVTSSMRTFLQEGMTFAKARQLAVSQVYGEPLSTYLETPNNILAMEYLRQAMHIGWNVPALTTPRFGVQHDSQTPYDSFASASYLRKLDSLGSIEPYMPSSCYAVLQDAKQQGMYPADFSKLEWAVLAHLRRLSREQLAELPDVAEGLQNRFYNAIRQAGSLSELETLLKTKRYTMARIRRLILSAFLDIKQSDLETRPPYIRVLGCNTQGRQILSAMKNRSTLPVHTSLARLREMGKTCAHFAKLEERSTDLYALTLPQPFTCGYEYTESAVFLNE